MIQKSSSSSPPKGIDPYTYKSEDISCFNYSDDKDPSISDPSEFFVISLRCNYLQTLSNKLFSKLMLLRLRELTQMYAFNKGAFASLICFNAVKTG